uniref:Uncharacterized protein n=1 Tax=Arundo donax TaxID=35708 RepID=A0A0A9E8S7_ARUDO
MMLPCEAPLYFGLGTSIVNVSLQVLDHLTISCFYMSSFLSIYHKWNFKCFPHVVPLLTIFCQNHSNCCLNPTTRHRRFVIHK